MARERTAQRVGVAGLGKGWSPAPLGHRPVCWLVVVPNTEWKNRLTSAPTTALLCLGDEGNSLLHQEHMFTVLSFSVLGTADIR